MRNTKKHPWRFKYRLTYLEAALRDKLHERGGAITTNYGLFLELRDLYKNGRDLYLRKALPDTEELGKRREHLFAANTLRSDPDYPSGVYRITDNNDGEAEEIICLVDSFCCVAYLSAMARYGLTDRRPQAVHLKRPNRQLYRRLIKERMARDYGEEFVRLEDDQIFRLRGISHPSIVRRRPIKERQTQHMGNMTNLRDSNARLPTIGQTFVDMLEHPGSCGGMAHVIEVWDEHADLYIDKIVAAIDQHPRPIIKVRAGYILEERLGITDAHIQSWTQYAQRGGSRILDPDRPFAAHFSEKWMLSLNVE